MSNYKHMSDDYLKRNYVPNVYQPSIYAINYQKLKDAGIKLISFDIDGTIASLVTPDPPKEAVTLFKELKRMGFDLVLLPNTRDARAGNFADKLGISGHCIARAEMPLTTHFQTMKDFYGVEKSQMAHVGDDMRADVAGGNAFGITTCLVRRTGITSGLIKRVLGVQTKGQKLRKELKERGIWRKHHKNAPGDQYYQLRELPSYQQPQDIAEAAAADLIRQFEADKDMVLTFNLEEIQRNQYNANKREGVETLCTHLGDDIAFTGMWADAGDERWLKEDELSAGEMSGTIFTVGCYTVRYAECLLRDDDAVHLWEKVPAGPDEIAAYQKQKAEQRGLALSPFGQPGNGLRVCQVVSAKHKDASDWQDVCLATTAVRSFWSEDILFIGTVKYDASAPDGQEMLFVHKGYVGDSFSVVYWYKLSSNGTVSEYEEHPYNPESFKKSWREPSESETTC